MTLHKPLRCSTCSSEWEPKATRLRCDCGGPLEVVYGHDNASTPTIRDDLPGLWRYTSLLPIKDTADIVSLAEGRTPLLTLNGMSERYGVKVLLKDEGLNPTGSFKARGASVAVSALRALGVRGIAMPSVGSGGSAWSAYAARAGLKMHVGLAVAETSPVIGSLEPPWYGAELQVINGDPAEVFPKYAAGFRSTDTIVAGAFAEPYRVEGEKTIMYEICEDLDWTPPSAIIWPTGGAAGLVGLAKAFDELLRVGWIGAGSATCIVSAQHETCAPIAEALRDGLPLVNTYRPGGIAPGVWVGQPSFSEHILHSLRARADVDGVTGDDRDIESIMREVARTDGILLSPEGALSVHGLSQLAQAGRLDEAEVVVCVNTANFLRYPHLLHNRSEEAEAPS